jgi:hypothetical protein
MEIRQMQSAVAELIPAHLSVVEAERRMEREGFQVARPSPSELYCDRMDGGWFNPVKRKWQVIIAIREDRVFDATVTTGLIGP